jgi:hypothetical protein
MNFSWRSTAIAQEQRGDIHPLNIWTLEEPLASPVEAWQLDV